MNKTKQKFMRIAILVFGVIGILDLSGVIGFFDINYITAVWMIPIFLLSIILSISLTINNKKENYK